MFIENVGNLVCPSSYDLGEHAKIVLLSVTEGEDKPLKYPSIFSRSELLVLNKIDLLPYVRFNLPLARENACRVHPSMEIIELSCTTGEGFDAWMNWLKTRARTCVRDRRTMRSTRTNENGPEQWSGPSFCFSIQSGYATGAS